MNQIVERPWMSIAPERVTAQIRVPAGQMVNLSTLRDLLTSLGVIYGADAKALYALSVISVEERIMVVAHGQPAPGDIVNRQVHIATLVKVPSTVVAGNIIGRLDGEGPFFGRAVDGQMLWPKLPPACGYGIMLTEKGELKCACAGTLQRDANGTVFVDVDFETVEMTSVTINFDEEKIRAYITIPAGHYLPPYTLYQALMECKVVRGVINKAVIEANVAQITERRLEVAHGVPACHGANGRVEMIIDDQIHIQRTENGCVDYREHGRIEDVAGGTALGRILPPTLGVHGVDVCGAFLAPKPGRVLDPAQVIGEGAEIDPVQPDIIRAKTIGHFHRDRSEKLCVQDRFTVEEHVDYHQGNVRTDLSVLIKGDIRAGFTVKSGSNIEVMGVIEDARVTAQGYLIIRGGILPGEQRIKAHGNIDAKHVAGRTIKCHGIRVTNSLRWSQVMAVGDVNAKEILCGSVIAGGNITCDIVGNEDGSRTLVQAGLNPYAAELCAGAQRELPQLKALVSKLEAQSVVKEQLASMRKISGKEWKAAVAEFNEASKKLAACKALVDAGEIERKRRAVTPCKAVIVVNGTAYRGTEIWLGDRAHIVLTNDVLRATFYEKDGVVAW